MIRNLVFDWAGTLADDGALTWSATNAVLEEFGAEPVSEATFARECQAPVAAFYGARIPSASMDEVERVFRGAYASEANTVSLREGVLELLTESHGRGLSLFVCSTLPAEIIWGVLNNQGLSHFISDVIGCASQKTPALAKLLQENGLHGDETLMIGDSPHDIEAGSACRVATAAVLGGQGSKSDLRAASPENVFADPRELLSFLREDQERATDRLVIPTVGGFIIDGESGKILLVRTRKWSGLWGLPGGKIDVGETMEQAWLREAKEETGLELEGSEFLLVQDSVFSKEFVDRRHFLLINFVSVVRDASGLRLNHEIAESAWVSPSAAEAMELNEPTRVALAWARQKGLLEGDS